MSTIRGSSAEIETWFWLDFKQISLFLSDISVSAKEQATGVAQVGISISELDESTQSNAALVEETSAASGALTQQADVLQEEIANFRVA